MPCALQASFQECAEALDGEQGLLSKQRHCAGLAMSAVGFGEQVARHTSSLCPLLLGFCSRIAGL